MGGSVSEGDDYCIGDDYVGLNFWYDEHSHPYDEDALRRIMNALNEQLERDALDYFVASGHDEDYEKD